MILKLWTLFLLTFCISADALIINHRLILSKVADRNGRGPYSFQQDLIFQTPKGPVGVRENWIVSGNGSLAVEAKGTGSLENQLFYKAAYVNERKIISNGKKKTTLKLPSDWFEHLFHFRNSLKLRRKLIKWGLLPEGSAVTKSVTRDAEAEPSTEDFVSLARVDGTTTYFIGEAATQTQDSGEKKPGLWVQQDRFVLRKLRTPGGVTAVMSRLEEQSTKLTYAQEKKITWGDHLVQVKVSSVKSLPRKSSQLKIFKNFKSSRPNLIPAQFSSIKEFYERCR